MATVVVLVWPLLKPGLHRVAVPAAAVAVMVMTDVDRVFLGVHYPSDVVAGTILGVGLVLASYAGYTDWAPTHPLTAHPESLPGTPDSEAEPPGHRDAEPVGMAAQHTHKEPEE
jgi:undecaprenyl-diphosphatase